MHSGEDKGPLEELPDQQKPKFCRRKKPHRRTTTNRYKSARILGFTNVTRCRGQESARDLVHAELTTAHRTVDALHMRDDLRQRILQRPVTGLCGAPSTAPPAPDEAAAARSAD